MEVSDFKSTYGSGEKLLFNFTYEGQKYDGINTTIKVYQNDVLLGTYYCLSGDEWIVDFDIGEYVAVLSVEGHPEVAPVNATITVIEKPTLNVNNFISTYNSGAKLAINLITGDGVIITDANVTIKVFKSNNIFFNIKRYI